MVPFHDVSGGMPRPRRHEAGEGGIRQLRHRLPEGGDEGIVVARRANEPDDPARVGLPEGQGQHIGMLNGGGGGTRVQAMPAAAVAMPAAKSFTYWMS